MSSLNKVELALASASEDAKYWDDACDEIVTLMGATGVILAPANPHFRGQWMSCSKQLKLALPEYIEEEWHLNDPREEVTALTVKNGIATDAEVFPDKAKRHDIPFYKDFLCKYNFGVLTGVRTLTPNGYWAAFIHFANDHPGMCDEQYEKCKKLQQLIEETAIKASQIAHNKIASFAKFFSGSESEVFILDGHGTQTLRMDNQGKLNEKNEAKLLLPDIVKGQMTEEIEALCSSNPDLSLSTTYTFQEQGRLITVLVIQAPTNLRHFFMPFKVVAIRTLCSDMMALKQNRLIAEFDLTPSETSTLELLASGKSPASIAGLMGLKPTTVRQRLKTIFNKAEVSSQIELVALYNEL